jgi:hypothetical protein
VLKMCGIHIEEEFQGFDNVLAIKLQTLRRVIELIIKMKDSKTVKDYCTK